MPINLFDCLLVAVLVAGLVRGRKHGISQEVFRLVKWLVLLFGCALIYQPFGALICASGFFDALTSYLFAYLGAALFIFLAFSMLERRMARKLSGTDAFGRGEYYLGMGSGLLRYTCMVLVFLAVLNAREFRASELKAIEKSQVDSYGSTIFPTLRGLQVAVFEQSLTGPCIKNYLSFLLIAPTQTDRAVVPAPSNAPPRLVTK
jgi:uncharacterized membrane protein required for colicin V production